MGKIQVSLVLPRGADAAGGGFLLIRAASNSLSIDVKPKETEIIRVLSEARNQDKDLDELTAGWRSAEHVIAQLEDAILTQTLSRYVSNINRRIERKAASNNLGLGERKLIATRRRIGMRLTWPIDLV